MLVSQFRTRQFKKLQEHWYEKLKEKGFEDIEDNQSKNEFLKVWHSRYFSSLQGDVSQAKKEYFEYACSFLNTHPFETKRERRIWEFHCEGLSVRMISRRLKNVSKSLVANIINDLKKRMLNRT